MGKPEGSQGRKQEREMGDPRMPGVGGGAGREGTTNAHSSERHPDGFGWERDLFRLGLSLPAFRVQISFQI